MANLQDIFMEWQNNLKFREEFKKNPLQACKNAGFEIKPEDLAKFESILKLKEDNNKNEELDKRRQP